MKTSSKTTRTAASELLVSRFICRIGSIVMLQIILSRRIITFVCCASRLIYLGWVGMHLGLHHDHDLCRTEQISLRMMRIPMAAHHECLNACVSLEKEKNGLPSCLTRHVTPVCEIR
jgi:hypothetical protein